MEMKHLRATLEELGRDFVEELRRRMIEENAVATHNLYDSLACELEETSDGGFTLYLVHADYFHYVNENTRPHWPPREPIREWIEAKPVVPYPDTNGKLPTVQQLTFLISRKIAEEGTQGRYFFESTLNGLLEGKYRGKIQDAIYEDIKEELAGLI